MNNDYMVRCERDMVGFARWNNIYQHIKQVPHQRFGYGIRVETKYFADLEDIRDILPFRDHFFFLVSNRKKRHFPIHVDGIPSDHNAASVNWPIRNCDEQSITRWFECDEPRFIDNDRSFFLCEDADVREVHRAIMYSSSNMPYLFRGELLHSGECGENVVGNRVIVKWELDYENWTQACDGFRDNNYIGRE